MLVNIGFDERNEHNEQHGSISGFDVRLADRVKVFLRHLPNVYGDGLNGKKVLILGESGGLAASVI